MKFSRRAVLRDGVLTVGAGLMGPSIFNTLMAQPASGATAHATMQSNGKILVVVQLAGGNDGLNCVVPITDPLYKQYRPTIGLSAADTIPLTPQLGLNGKLSALKPLWDAKQMAVITNVGYPNPNLSHFQSSYIWETLDMTGAQGSSRTGWLGNYLKNSGATISQPFSGLDDGNQLSATFMAPGISVPTISSANNFVIAPDSGSKATSAQRNKAVFELYQSFAQENAQNPQAMLLANVAQVTNTATIDFAKANANYKPAVPYPAKNTLADGLKIIATAITQGLNMNIGYASIGGFDTHAAEVTVHDTLYPTVAGAIAAFWQDMHAQNMADKIVMMTWSEFGRRPKENGSNGTDHGTASPLFVFGPSVAGGVHGDPPDLKNLDPSGNLIFKTDFRSVYATIIDKWLGGNSQTVLGGSYPTLDFIK